MHEYIMLSRQDKNLLENMDAETAHAYLTAILDYAFDGVDAKPSGLAGELYEIQRAAAARQYRKCETTGMKQQPADSRVQVQQPRVAVHKDERGLYDFVVKIFKKYPKKYAFNQCIPAVTRVFDELKSKGKSSDEAKAFIFDAVTAYSAAVSKWPRADYRFILNLQKFLDDGHIYDDRSTWERDPGDVPDAGGPAYITLPDGTRRKASVL